jgi:branched-chain amino acid transport system substrate-binding protein
MSSSRLSKFGAAVLACAAIVGVAACGSSNKSSSSSSSAGSTTSGGGTSSDALGTAKPASGSPVAFGMVNLATNPAVNFPELASAAQAGVKYVNQYRGGIGGHPIKLVVCPTDGQPSGTAKCANQLVAQHVKAVLGGADIAGAAAFPIYQRAKLAYVGGANITPAEATAPNSVIFNDMAQSDNVDLGTYTVEKLHAKKVAIIPVGDNQGKFQAQNFIVPGVKAKGGQYKIFPLPPSQADASPVVASALAYKPDAIILESPSQCVALLNALKSLGNTKPVLSIDPCAAPNVIQATNGAANGVYIFSAYQLYDGDSADAKLARAIIAKYAPAKQVIDSPALQGLNTVMNLQDAFKSTDPSKLTTAYILKTLRAGSDHPNFLSTPYTCNKQAVPALPALCNAKYYVDQIQGDKLVIKESGYDTGAQVLKLGPPPK